MKKPLIIAELGSCFKPGKPKTLLDAAKAARDCGADMVKIQVYNTQGLAWRRGCPEKKLKPWALLDDGVPQGLLRELAKIVPFGASVFAGGSHLTSICQCGPQFLKTATQEYQAVHIVSEVCIRALAFEKVQIYASFQIPTVPHVGNYVSKHPIVWMACVPQYPAQNADYVVWGGYPSRGQEARYIRALHNVPGLLGLSDHTLDFWTTECWLKEFPNLFAIERHFCYNESLRGKTPDAGPWSLSRRDFKDFVKTVRGSR